MSTHTAPGPRATDAFLRALRHAVPQLPGMIILKGLDSRILAMNDATARLLGVAPGATVEGAYEWEVAPFLAPCAAAFRAQDAETLARGSLRFIDVVTYVDGTPRAILSQKVCLRDLTGAPCALLFQGIDVSGHMFGRIGALLLQHVDRVRVGHPAVTSYALESPETQRPLSDREAECLFFLLRGQTARGIAKRLNLSVRTVESYIEQLKNSFGCDSKSALIEGAIAEGYSNHLPPSFLAR